MSEIILINGVAVEDNVTGYFLSILIREAERRDYEESWGEHCEMGGIFNETYLSKLTAHAESGGDKLDPRPEGPGKFYRDFRLQGVILGEDGEAHGVYVDYINYNGRE